MFLFSQRFLKTFFFTVITTAPSTSGRLLPFYRDKVVGCVTDVVVTADTTSSIHCSISIYPKAVHSVEEDHPLQIGVCWSSLKSIQQLCCSDRISKQAQCPNWNRIKPEIRQTQFCHVCYRVISAYRKLSSSEFAIKADLALYKQELFSSVILQFLARKELINNKTWRFRYTFSSCRMAILTSFPYVCVYVCLCGKTERKTGEFLKIVW